MFRFSPDDHDKICLRLENGDETSTAIPFVAVNISVVIFWRNCLASLYSSGPSNLQHDHIFFGRTHPTSDISSFLKIFRAIVVLYELRKVLETEELSTKTNGKALGVCVQLQFENRQRKIH